MSNCKYYDKHLDTVREYIYCLYNLEDCSAGGLLHILLDDDSYDDDSIVFCLKECLRHPEREESQIGQLICQEYLKLSMEQRRLLCLSYTAARNCFNKGNCGQCFICRGDDFF